MPCSFRFRHPDRPRDTCGLPSAEGERCELHSGETSPRFAETLQLTAAAPGHWLEGVCAAQDLNGLRLSGARLPNAVFEGCTLSGVAMDECLLDGANFRESNLHGVSFYGASIRRAAFDRAHVFILDGTPTDFRCVELGGTTFTGCHVHSSIRLNGLRLSEPTAIRPLLESPCFEMANAMWMEAASSYAALGKRAVEDWDFDAAQTCSLLAMTCRHRQAIAAGPIRRSGLGENWLRPSIAAGVRGIGWFVHRGAWSYGLAPNRLISLIVAIIVVCGLVVYPLVGVCRVIPNGGCAVEAPWLGGLATSLSTVSTLGYGHHIPKTTAGMIVLGVESFAIAVMLSLYVVSLTTKFLRRL